MTWQALAAFARQRVEQWQQLPLDSLQFWQRDAARLAVIGLVSIAVLLLVARWTLARTARRRGVALPAVLPAFGRSHTAWLRYTPIVLMLCGIPFAVIALADPYTALVSEQVTYPGRRIGLMIDASTSMQTTFTTETLKTRAKTGPAFFTTVAAAERFVQLRREGNYRDLMALVEFGNQAYVITPFTNDYDNILLSIALISDPVEFALFPDRGTVIARALEQSLEVFKAFEFLEAAGNLMVIFTDGEDTTAIVEGRSLDEVLQVAVDHRIPLYFVRTNFRKGLGELIPDAMWKRAVEKTGGRFYAVSDESSLLQAIADINREASGDIQVRQYTSQQPRFEMFAFIAAVFWSAAAGLKLGGPWFQTFP